MRLIAKERGLTYQQIFIIFVATCLSILIYKSNPLQLLAIAGIVLIVATSFLRVQTSLLVILAVKPFLDLAWDVRFFSLGQKSINVLHLTGLYVALLAGSIYFFKRDSQRKFNEPLIWCFIAMHLFASQIGLWFYSNSLINTVDSLLRLFDAYFIYLIFHQFYRNNEGKFQFIVKTIWISTFIVSGVSIILYLSGNYNVDISQEVERFSGLYNDPGGPSYTAIMSLIFGTLYMEMLKRKGTTRAIHYILYIVAILVTLIILAITLTKSAFLMFFVFVFMWVGIYKKKMYIILPLLIIGSIYIYSTSEKVQSRMENEVRFFSEGKFTIEAARPMGTGRVARWERAVRGYFQLNSLKKIFGIYRNAGAHNQYLAYLIEVGVIGLMIFLVILIRFMKKLIILYRKLKKPEIFAALLVLAMFIVYGMTGHPFEYTTLLWYLMILLSTVNFYSSNSTYKKTLNSL